MRLTKIYTKTGDGGTTRLANGEEVSKDSLRVSAYGDVDELNSLLGLVLTESVSQDLHTDILAIQHQLFDLGGELASAGMIEGLITDEAVIGLEKMIDRINADLPALKEFILPGGNKTASLLHLARTVCRRSERRIIALDKAETVSAAIIKYINRLSDLLFVMARSENYRSSNEEVYWNNPRK